jgi:hypothetical protein
MVHDPTRSDSAGDFYSKAMHSLALEAIALKSLPSDLFTVKTAIPLPLCEPLVGMRSMTCSDFTAFTLSFKISKSDIELSKFSNGSTGLSLAIPTPSGASLYLFTQSPGFDENSKAKIAVDLPLGPNKVHASLDMPSMDNPEPVLTLGSVINVNKHVDLIAQLEKPVNGQPLSTIINFGAKLQPCGHFHTGLGFEALTDGLGHFKLQNIHSSTFFATHAGGTFALIGKYGFLTPHSLQLAVTSQMKLWKQAQKEPDTPGPYLVSPYPTVGLSYDLVSSRTCAFVDMSIGAWNPSTTERDRGVNLNLKVGVNILKSNWREPHFGVHLSAAEA